MMKRSPTLQGLRYVHIEEDETEVARIQQALQAGGYEPQPLVVQTADELVAAIEQSEWDLILTDWTLPTFSAKAALAQLADRGVDLPMIVVSKVAGEEVVIDALKAGAHDYVLKERLVRLVPAVKHALQKDAERKAYRVMEETLRENQGDFRKLIEGAPLGIFFAGCTIALYEGEPSLLSHGWVP